ncbi:stearoyl-CoA 9-desaturase [Paraphaeosphaeria minitans]|uniref:Acyl-CoA desaturase n=1 Tax=Paraphaeosphaeria minitans TaxID=565426 RepID=A0A9P6G9A7_9PLEO|nr:delta-9 fatty acid desaturase [Paraphaeosphaeria minitans]
MGEKRPRTKVHISDQAVTLQNWYKHINWFSTTLVVLVPTYGLYACRYVPLTRATAIWATIYYFFTGFGITGGYHRLWSHRCYNARLPLRLFLAFVGAGAIQGSIRFWSSKHRAHHRWTDTQKDPYCALKGFFHAHIGWMVLNQDPKKIGRTDISDLDADPVVVWQHTHYGKSLLVAAWLFPMCVAGLGWGDWWGGLVYAGILRACFVQQATFCVNSLAHWLGEQPFDDRRTPRDHFVTALVTLGEGYHNFHHEFPSDYRNAISWYQYDPTKWLIFLLSKTTLAYDLKRFRHNEIEKGRLQQQQKALDARRATLDWGLPLSQLPVLSWDEFQSRCASGEAALVAIAGIIHDVTDFIAEHPGGRALIKGWVGKDATAVFNGGVYMHSNAAHNLLSTIRVGVLRGGQEVEVWKEERETYVKDKMGQIVVRANDHITNVKPLVATADAA